jgi:23S rRNA pseudouridine1911/1915/1917 synthase
MRKATERFREKRREQRADNAPPVCTASYKVNHSDELLEFLLRKCNTSRNNVKSLLARRQVLVNGGVVTQFDYPLAKDDEVKIAKNPVAGNDAKKREARKKEVKPRLRILYEDGDFIAVDKPVGLLSVESDKDAECAYAYVAEYLAAQGARPFVLHRIDKETSGVLVFAKNPKIHSMLRLKWNDLVTLREYHAVVEGALENKADTLVCYLKENANHLMYATSDPTGQKAVTKYQVERENGQYSLLKVEIETGRKNQIRVQMHKIGHPVVGDDKYGCSKNPLKRLGLHATKLSFIHPVSKEIVSVHAAPPCAFRDLFGG